MKKTVQVNHPLHYKGLAFYQSNYGALHDVTLGIQWKDKKEKASFKVLEGDTVPVPNSNTLIRVLQYSHEVHNFGEGVQVVLFKPNQEPRPFWLLKNFPQLDQQRGDEFVLTFEGFTEKEYTGLSVTKDPGVWVVWIGCGLMIFGFIVSFFFSHQRVWVRIPKSPGGEIVLAGSANKNRVGFEKTFGELVEEIRKRSLRVIHFLGNHESPIRVANHYLHRTHPPRWTRDELPEEGKGLAFFRNAVQYIRNHSTLTEGRSYEQG